MSTDDWENLKESIRHWYLTEDKEGKDVIELLGGSGFNVT